MQTSAPGMASNNQQGFTLIEIIVVALIVGVIAMMVVPQLVRGDASRQATEVADRLHALVEACAEQALFRGRVFALELSDTSASAFQYDAGSGRFVAASGRAFEPLLLPDALRLEWQQDQEGDPRAFSTLAADALSAHQQQLQSKSGNQAASPNASGTDAPVPQIFCFPSGEVSPMVLTLRDQDSGDGRRFQLNVIGGLNEIIEDSDTTSPGEADEG